jgi:UDP-perosamine 4-acetyltransferase
MTKPIYIVGGGRHGKVVLDALLAAGVTITGVIDPALKVGDTVFGVPVVGDDHYLDNVAPETVVVINGIGGNPATDARKRVSLTLTARGFTFHNVQHPSAFVGRECQLGQGAQIMAGAVLQNGVVLGENTVINTSASIDHGCHIGAHTFVSPGAVLCGDVIVGEGVFVGAGCVLMPEVKVGTGAIIGGGAVVIKNVPAGWTVAGNPAEKIG